MHAFIPFFAKILFYLTLFVLVPMFIVLAELCPKVLINKFMKPPHYSKGDILPYSLYPLKIYRGIGFAGVVAWPILGRYRKLSNMRDFAPLWWKILSFIFCWLVFLPIIFCWIVIAVYVAMH